MPRKSPRLRGRCWIAWLGISLSAIHGVPPATAQQAPPDVAAPIQALIQSLANDDGNARAAALDALAERGPAAHEAIPALLSLLQSDGFYRSRQAAAALRRILPGAEQSVEALLAATRHPRPHVRRNALWALGAVEAKAAVPRLVELLDDDDDSVRREAAVLLGELGPAARPAIPRLAAALLSPQRIDREIAAQALRRIDPQAAPPQAAAEPARAKNNWPQWGGSSLRNNALPVDRVPVCWNYGEFDRDTGAWLANKAENVRWVAALGTQTYGNPVVAGGKIFVGTNNGAGYIPRYPPEVDLGCLVCFRESDGQFLWQHSSEKLRTGRVHDWPMRGISSTPVVEGDRLWFVTNRGEVRCLDVNGFRDGENDGPFQDEPAADEREADVVWVFDMMRQLGVSQYIMANCSPTIWGDALFVCTSNGVDNSEIVIPNIDAPSFIALDKNTGEVLWTDKSPGANIFREQWSSPAAGILAGIPQVIFAGGDGWLYSFRADRWQDGRPEWLWKFDYNRKSGRWIAGGRGRRNTLVAFPVIYDGLVYVAAGQDPEHGEGQGMLWCLDPSRRGDVSAELCIDDQGAAIPFRRISSPMPFWGFTASVSVRDWDGLDRGEISRPLRSELIKHGIDLPDDCRAIKEALDGGWQIRTHRLKKVVQYRFSHERTSSGGDAIRVESQVDSFAVPNPNSAVVWHYDGYDRNGDGRRDFEEVMHRSVGSPAISNDLLAIADLSGVVHCLNAKTGVPYWTYELASSAWSAPLVVADKVYVADEDGDVTILPLSARPRASVDRPPRPLNEINMGTSLYTVPVAAKDRLYLATRTHLFAIEETRGPASPER